MLDEPAKAEEQCKPDEHEGQDSRPIFQIPQTNANYQVHCRRQKQNDSDRSAKPAGQTMQDTGVRDARDQPSANMRNPMTLMPARAQTAPINQVKAAMIETPSGRIRVPL